MSVDPPHELTVSKRKENTDKKSPDAVCIEKYGWFI